MPRRPSLWDALGRIPRTTRNPLKGMPAFEECLFVEVPESDRTVCTARHERRVIKIADTRHASFVRELDLHFLHHLLHTGKQATQSMMGAKTK